MPRGDGTGPMGYGPMTGRGLGYCSGSEVPGYATGWGPGFGRGSGVVLVVVWPRPEEVSDGASERFCRTPGGRNLSEGVAAAGKKDAGRAA